MTNRDFFVQAFKKADEREMAEYRNKAAYSHDFSQSFEKKMDVLVAKHRRISLNTRRKISRALLAAIIAVSVLFTGIMSVSATREKVVGFVENIFKTNITVHGNSAWGEHDGDWYYKTWTGDTISPDIKVWLNDGYWQDGEWINTRKDLVEGRDYELSLGNNVDMGYCRIIITGIGDYSDIDITKRTGEGEKEKTEKYEGPIFVIRPLGTALEAVEPQKNSVSVKWKQQAKRMSRKHITGYQLQLSTSEKFEKGKTKTVTVKGYENTQETLEGVNSGSKYYVRIRTYFECVDGFKAYSVWSDAKAFTTK